MLDKNIVFRVDEATHKRFAKMCKGMGLKNSQVIRMMIDRCIDDSSFILSIISKNLPAPNKEPAASRK